MFDTHGNETVFEAQDIIYLDTNDPTGIQKIGEKWSSHLQQLLISTEENISVSYDFSTVGTSSQGLTQRQVVVLRGIQFQCEFLVRERILTSQEIQELIQDIRFILLFPLYHLLVEDNLKRTARKLTHDLKNMIAGIVGLSFLAKKNPQSVDPSETQSGKDYFTKLEACTSGALRLVSRVPEYIDYALHPIGKNICKKEQDIGQFTKRVIDTYNANVHITFTDQKQGQVYVNFDEVALQRTFDNLIQNAIRYRKDDQIFAQLTVSIQNNVSIGSGLIIMFEDAGKGLSEHDINAYKQAHVKAPEYDGNPHRDSTRLGAGNIMQILTAHGWTLDIKSVPGKYSQFLIQIPQEDCVN